MSQETKYCKHCGQIIDADCVVCPKCGKQVEELKFSKPDNIIINNIIMFLHLHPHLPLLHLSHSVLAG